MTRISACLWRLSHAVLTSIRSGIDDVGSIVNNLFFMVKYKIATNIVLLILLSMPIVVIVDYFDSPEYLKEKYPTLFVPTTVVIIFIIVFIGVRLNWKSKRR